MKTENHNFNLIEVVQKEYRDRILTGCLGNICIEQLNRPVNNGLELQGISPSVFCVYLPAHPFWEPRDRSIVITTDNHDDQKKILAENIAQSQRDYCSMPNFEDKKALAQKIDKWRTELIEFGLRQGLRVIVSPTQVCPKCDGLPIIPVREGDITSEQKCSSCEGVVPNQPLVKNGIPLMFRACHIVGFQAP